MSFRDHPYSQRGSERLQQPARTQTTGRSAQAAERAVKLPTFEIVGVMPVRTGNLLAFADVRIGREPTAIIGREPTAIIGRKFRLVQQMGQRPFLSAPQESWNDPTTGERRFKTLFEFPKAWREPLSDTVIAAWREYEAKQQQEAGAPS